MSYKRFVNYAVFTAADAQLLMDQGIIPVANAAERNALVTDGYAFVGMHVYRADTSRLERYSGPVLGWTAAEGMILLKRVTGTAAASLIADGVFSSLFKRYKITSHLRASAATALNVRLRSGGKSETGASVYGNTRAYVSTASAFAALYASSSAWTIFGIAGTEIDFSLELQGLQDSAEQTQGHGTGSSRGGTVGNSAVLWSGHLGNTNNYDGIILEAGAITLTGDLTVYGII